MCTGTRTAHSPHLRSAAFLPPLCFASECRGLIGPIGVTLYKLREAEWLAHINELWGEGGRAATDRNARREEGWWWWGGSEGKKYVEMTKADAMQEASGEDETRGGGKKKKKRRDYLQMRESSLPFP